LCFPDDVEVLFFGVELSVIVVEVDVSEGEFEFDLVAGHGLSLRDWVCVVAPSDYIVRQPYSDVNSRWSG